MNPNHEHRTVPSDSDSPCNRMKHKHTAYTVKEHAEEPSQSWIGLPRVQTSTLFEAVWDHLKRERNKREPAFKEGF